MIKYIIRERDPEYSDFSGFFDCDCYNENSGDYLNTLFIVPSRNCRGYNEEEYNNVVWKAEHLLEDFNDIKNKWSFGTYKECMNFYQINFSPKKCHDLKEWAKSADPLEAETIAEFLTITTGHKWTTGSATGYCQGDYVEMVYCQERYKNGVQAEGELWLGCGKEFYVIEIDENGEEIDSCGGFYVADCQAWRDEDYKKLVCEWYCINEKETRLEMIDNSYTVTKYTYRTA